MNRKNTTTKSQTDWERLDAMTDDDIDYSDIPPITDEMWARGVLRKGRSLSRKNSSSLRVDQDVVDFLRNRDVAIRQR